MWFATMPGREVSKFDLESWNVYDNKGLIG